MSDPRFQTEEEQEEEEDNIVPFQPKIVSDTGGKLPPTTASDWLTPLEVGTVFYVQRRNDGTDFNLGLFRKAAQLDKVVQLQLANPSAPPQEIYVNPVRFCNIFMKYQEEGILITTPQEQEQGGEDDGNRDELAGGDQKDKVE